MPRVSKCTFLRCALRLTEDDRENFAAWEASHWKTDHTDEPFSFICGHTGKQVVMCRNADDDYKFVCVCKKSSVLSTASVKRHYDMCRVVKKQVAALPMGANPSSSGDPTASSPGFSGPAAPSSNDPTASSPWHPSSVVDSASNSSRATTPASTALSAEFSSLSTAIISLSDTFSSEMGSLHEFIMSFRDEVNKKLSSIERAQQRQQHSQSSQPLRTVYPYTSEHTTNNNPSTSRSIRSRSRLQESTIFSDEVEE